MDSSIFQQIKDKALLSEHDSSIEPFSGIYDPLKSYKKFDYAFSKEDGRFFYAKRDIDNGGTFAIEGAYRFFLDPEGPENNDFKTHYIFDEANTISTENVGFEPGQKIKLEGSINGADGFYEVLNYERNLSASNSISNQSSILLRLDGTKILESSGDEDWFWFTSSWFLKTADGSDEAFLWSTSMQNNFIFHQKLGWMALSLEDEENQYDTTHEISFYLVGADDKGQWAWSSKEFSRYTNPSTSISERPSTFVYLFDSENKSLGSEGWAMVGTPDTEELKALYGYYFYNFSENKYFFINKENGNSTIDSASIAPDSVLGSINFENSFGVADVPSAQLPETSESGLINKFTDSVQSRIQIRGLPKDGSDNAYKSNSGLFNLEESGGEEWFSQKIFEQFVGSQELYIFNRGKIGWEKTVFYYNGYWNKYNMWGYRSGSYVKTYHPEKDSRQTHYYDSSYKKYGAAGFFAITSDHYNELQKIRRHHIHYSSMSYSPLMGWAGQDYFSKINFEVKFSRVVDQQDLKSGNTYYVYERGQNPTSIKNITNDLDALTRGRSGSGSQIAPYNGDTFTAHTDSSSLPEGNQLEGDTVFVELVGQDRYGEFTSSGINISQDEISLYESLPEKTMLVYEQNFSRKKSRGNNSFYYIDWKAERIDNQVITLVLGKDVFDLNLSSISAIEQKSDHVIKISSIGTDISSSDSWTYDDFFFDADYGSTVSFKADTHIEKYGNGYFVARPKDINSMTCEFNLNFKNRTSREANSILHFLESHQGQYEKKRETEFLEYKAGIEGFRWDGNSTFHPYDSLDNQSKDFYCREFSHKINFENNHDVSAKLVSYSSSLLNKSESIFVKPAESYSNNKIYREDDVVFEPDNHQYYYCKPTLINEETGELQESFIGFDPIKKYIPLKEIKYGDVYKVIESTSGFNYTLIGSDSNDIGTAFLYNGLDIDENFSDVKVLLSKKAWDRNDSGYESINKDVWTQDFNWKPSANFSINHEPRTSLTEIGKSYKQTYKDGINVNRLKFSVSFENRDDLEAYSILHFLEHHYGCIPFSFKPPSPYKRKSFICSNWSHTYNYKNSHSILAEFEEFSVGIDSSDILNLVTPSPVAPGRLMVKSPIEMSSEQNPIISSKPFIKRIELENLGSGSIEIVSLSFDGAVFPSYYKKFGESYIPEGYSGEELLSDDIKAIVLNEIFPFDNLNEFGQIRSWDDWLKKNSLLSSILNKTLIWERPEYWTVRDFTKEMLRMVYLYLPEHAEQGFSRLQASQINGILSSVEGIRVILRDMIGRDEFLEEQFIDLYSDKSSYEDTASIIRAIYASSQFKSVADLDVKVISKDLSDEDLSAKVNSVFDYASELTKFEQALTNELPIQREKIRFEKYNDSQQSFKSEDQTVEGEYYQKNNGDIFTPYKSKIEPDHFLNRELFLKHGSNKLEPFSRGYIDLVINEGNSEDFFSFVGNEEDKEILWDTSEGDTGGRIKISIINSDLSSNLQIEWVTIGDDQELQEPNTLSVSVNNWLSGDPQEEAIVDSAKPLSEEAITCPSVYFLKTYNNPVHPSNIIKGEMYCVHEYEETSVDSYIGVGCNDSNLDLAFIATDHGLNFQWGKNDFVVNVRSLDSNRHNKGGGAIFLPVEKKPFSESEFPELDCNPFHNKYENYDRYMRSAIGEKTFKNKYFNIDHFLEVENDTQFSKESRGLTEDSGGPTYSKIASCSLTKNKDPRFFPGFPCSITRPRNFKGGGTVYDLDYGKNFGLKGFESFSEASNETFIIEENPVLQDLYKSYEGLGNFNYQGSTFRRLAQESVKAFPLAVDEGDMFSIENIDSESLLSSMQAKEKYIIESEDKKFGDTDFSLLTSWLYIEPNRTLINHIAHCLTAPPEEQINQWAGLGSYKKHINEKVDLDSLDVDVDQLLSMDNMQDVIDYFLDKLKAWQTSVPIDEIQEGDLVKISRDSELVNYYDLGLEYEEDFIDQPLIGRVFVFNGNDTWSNLDLTRNLSQLNNGDFFEVIETREGFDFTDVGAFENEVGSLGFSNGAAVSEEFNDIRVKLSLPYVTLLNQAFPQSLKKEDILLNQTYELVTNPIGDEAKDLLLQVGCLDVEEGSDFVAIANGRDVFIDQADQGIRFIPLYNLVMYMPEGTVFTCTYNPLNDLLLQSENRKMVDFGSKATVQILLPDGLGAKWSNQSLPSPILGAKYLFEDPDFHDYFIENWASFVKESYDPGVSLDQTYDFTRTGNFPETSYLNHWAASNKPNPNQARGMIPGSSDQIGWLAPGVVYAFFSTFTYMLQEYRKKNGIQANAKLGQKLFQYAANMIAYEWVGTMPTYTFDDNKKEWVSNGTVKFPSGGRTPARDNSLAAYNWADTRSDSYYGDGVLLGISEGLARVLALWSLFAQFSWCLVGAKKMKFHSHYRKNSNASIYKNLTWGINVVQRWIEESPSIDVTYDEHPHFETWSTISNESTLTIQGNISINNGYQNLLQKSNGQRLRWAAMLYNSDRLLKPDGGTHDDTVRNLYWNMSPDLMRWSSSNFVNADTVKSYFEEVPVLNNVPLFKFKTYWDWLLSKYKDSLGMPSYIPGSFNYIDLSGLGIGILPTGDTGVRNKIKSTRIQNWNADQVVRRLWDANPLSDITSLPSKSGEYRFWNTLGFYYAYGSQPLSSPVIQGIFNKPAAMQYFAASNASEFIQEMQTDGGALSKLILKEIEDGSMEVANSSEETLEKIYEKYFSGDSTVKKLYPEDSWYELSGKIKYGDSTENILDVTWGQTYEIEKVGDDILEAQKIFKPIQVPLSSIVAGEKYMILYFEGGETIDLSAVGGSSSNKPGDIVTFAVSGENFIKDNPTFVGSFFVGKVADVSVGNKVRFINTPYAAVPINAIVTDISIVISRVGSTDFTSIGGPSASSQYVGQMFTSTGSGASLSGDSEVEIAFFNMSGFKLKPVYPNYDLPPPRENDSYTAIVDGSLLDWNSFNLNNEKRNSVRLIRGATVIENKYSGEINLTGDSLSVNVKSSDESNWEIPAHFILKGEDYQIITNPGGDDFSQIGALSNSVGTKFTASENGSYVNWSAHSTVIATSIDSSVYPHDLKSMPNYSQTALVEFVNTQPNFEQEFVDAHEGVWVEYILKAYNLEGGHILFPNEMHKYGIESSEDVSWPVDSKKAELLDEGVLDNENHCILSIEKKPGEKGYSEVYEQRGICRAFKGESRGSSGSSSSIKFYGVIKSRFSSFQDVANLEVEITDKAFNYGLTKNRNDVYNIVDRNGNFVNIPFGNKLVAVNEYNSIVNKKKNQKKYIALEKTVLNNCTSDFAHAVPAKIPDNYNSFLCNPDDFESVFAEIIFPSPSGDHTVVHVILSGEYKYINKISIESISSGVNRWQLSGDQLIFKLKDLSLSLEDFVFQYQELDIKIKVVKTDSSSFMTMSNLLEDKKSVAFFTYVYRGNHRQTTKIVYSSKMSQEDIDLIEDITYEKNPNLAEHRFMNKEIAEIFMRYISDEDLHSSVWVLDHNVQLKNLKITRQFTETETDSGLKTPILMARANLSSGLDPSLFWNDGILVEPKNIEKDNEYLVLSVYDDEVSDLTSVGAHSGYQNQDFYTFIATADGSDSIGGSTILVNISENLEKGYIARLVELYLGFRIADININWHEWDKYIGNSDHAIRRGLACASQQYHYCTLPIKSAMADDSVPSSIIDSEDMKKTAFAVPPLVHMGNNIGRAPKWKTGEINKNRESEFRVTTEDLLPHYLVDSVNYLILSHLELGVAYPEIGEVYTIASVPLLEEDYFDYSLIGGPQSNYSVGDTFTCSNEINFWQNDLTYSEGDHVVYRGKTYQALKDDITVGQFIEFEEWGQISNLNRIHGNFPSLGVSLNEPGEEFIYKGDYIELIPLGMVQLSNKSLPSSNVGKARELLGLKIDFKNIDSSDIVPSYDKVPSYLYALANTYSLDVGFLNPGSFSTRANNIFSPIDLHNQFMQYGFQHFYGKDTKYKFNYGCKKAFYLGNSYDPYEFYKAIHIGAHHSTSNNSTPGKYSLAETQASAKMSVMSLVGAYYKGISRMIHVDRFKPPAYKQFQKPGQLVIADFLEQFEDIFYFSCYFANNKRDYIELSQAEINSNPNFNVKGVIDSYLNKKERAYSLFEFTNGIPNSGDFIGKGMCLLVDGKIYGCNTHHVFDSGIDVTKFSLIQDFEDIKNFIESNFSFGNRVFRFQTEYPFWNNPSLGVRATFNISYMWVSNLYESFENNDYMEAISAAYNQNNFRDSMIHKLPIDIGKQLPEDNHLSNPDSNHRNPGANVFRYVGETLPVLEGGGLKVNFKEFLNLSENQKNQLRLVKEKINNLISDDRVVNISIFESAAGRFEPEDDTYAAASSVQEFLGMRKTNGSYRPAAKYGTIMFDPLIFLDEFSTENTSITQTSDTGEGLTNFYSTLLHETLHVLGLGSKNVGEIYNDIDLVNKTRSSSFSGEFFAIRLNLQDWGKQFYGKNVSEEYKSLVEAQIIKDQSVDDAEGYFTDTNGQVFYIDSAPMSNFSHFAETCKSLGEYIQPSFPFAVMTPYTLGGDYGISDKSNRMTLAWLKDLGWTISENAYNIVEPNDSKFMEPHINPDASMRQWAREWLERNYSLLL